MGFAQIISVVIWAILWGIGGILIIANLFSLEKEETFFAGLAAGLIIETWFANIFAQMIPTPLAFWIASIFVLILGGLCELRYRKTFPFQIRSIILPGSILLFFFLVILFTMIGRGLPIFDDFQNLPTVSRMATGDIPPHFAFDPDIRFGYHYFMLLISAQLVSLGAIFPSVALDIVRSALMILTVFLGSKLVFRMTKSRMAEFLGGVFLLFSTGIRWVLLFSPKSLQFILNNEIPLIGNSAVGGKNLFGTLISPWSIESGTFPFPFAFASGINPSMIMSLGGIGAAATLIIFLFLLTYNRRKTIESWVITTILISSLALADEVWFFLIGAGVCIVAIIGFFLKKLEIDRKEILNLLLIMFPAFVISLFQGGMLTELFRKFISNANHTASGSYYDTTIKFVFPPTLVSGHLGILSFANPVQLITGLLEMGPISCVFPLFIGYLISCFKKKDMAMMIFGSAGIVSILTVFIQFQGSGGVSGTTRLLEGFLLGMTVLAVPLFYQWLQDKQHWLKVFTSLLYSAGILGGIVFFGIGILSVSSPVNGLSIDQYDVEIFHEMWNTLPQNALVFDSTPGRAVTVLGRATRSSISWFETRKDWETLTQNPLPTLLADQGYSYVYFNYRDWAALSGETQAAYRKGCPKLIKLIQGDQDIRRIYQIDGCN